MKRTLYFHEGTSDKEYSVELVDLSNGRFNVMAYWGRRGSATQSQQKNKVPLARTAAETVMDNLLAEKRAKGYLPGVESTARQVAQQNGTLEVVPPMLLVPIDSAMVDRLLVDDQWLAQPKWDGKRLQLHHKGGQVFGISRSGKPLALPVGVVRVAQASLRDFVLDGELVDDIFICFDCLRDGELNLMNEHCSFRVEHAARLFNPRPDTMFMSPTAYDTEEKQTMFQGLMENGGEGIVFKFKTSPYRSGRSGAGWTWLKRKFWDRASVIVGDNHRENTRSVGMYLCDGTYLGNVSIAVNQAIPPMGSIIEVRFLYRSSENGGLIQPTFLQLRYDVRREECVAEELQVKGEEREEA